MRITVVGDVLLDVDLVGSAERFSPDGPVPVVDVGSSIRRPGGAGLVAAMLARDGHDVTLVTVLGEDAPGQEIRAALADVTVVAATSGAPTPVKTRLRADGHPIARIDEGCAPVDVPRVNPAMLDAVGQGSAIIVADYGRRLSENAELRRALDAAGRRVPLVWDPHPRGATPVPSTRVVTPNSSEAARATGVATDDVPGAAAAAEELVRRWGCHSVAVTLGARGALLSEGTGAVPLVVSAPRVRAEDPCGAGDRLAASLAVALGRGSGLPEALRGAVADASAYLAAGGVAALAAPPTPTPLPRDAVTALTVAREARQTGGTVVATGGCFDLLHAGHAHALSAARALGDCLIVCLNSDDSVRRLKGPTRPIMSEADRVDLLLALECVDAVIVFDEDTPEAVLRQIEPELWVKGGDYVAADLPEAAVLAEWGGRAVTVPFHPGRSSSALADAIAKVS
ncbi:PfkB family carbohydrate kinase [Salinibacterium sp. SYSU T00001]|uniref:PfkB family carbohydrate kinase n=1 Tax=Homoserinimonas sedimenticola TaxID=2986805 RepID=UPI0022367D36|nr:PfkB family carbohydrate kinase [Salinibacterium sedimenticola]MCW4385597.1 PfkB family carbohydrate kinase [Salinibacterium sedimenticola]